MQTWKVMLGVLVCGTAVGLTVGGSMHPVMKQAPEPEWLDRIEKRYVPTASSQPVIYTGPQDLDPPHWRETETAMTAPDDYYAYPSPYQPLDSVDAPSDRPASYASVDVDGQAEWAPDGPQVSQAATAAASAAADVRHALAAEAALNDSSPAPEVDAVALPAGDDVAPLL